MRQKSVNQQEQHLAPKPGAHMCSKPTYAWDVNLKRIMRFGTLRNIIRVAVETAMAEWLSYIRDTFLILCLSA